ncbi:MAG: type II toxin-antitoxin system VapC family toxin [Thiocapsa sp.]|uniref:type II toxin-antitoxin system VapC family toxin n=1 Tax=Thiocapsa sp. TaxID=2024551 RepID=UPI001BCE8F9E|nr:type II toxin-antitoxin system VapC family toxin [Thiocapsa sp.]QVL48162.1 MAG: type II toxin-antitoxin system VapC family toxin [Thiocapsa sp.]
MIVIDTSALVAIVFGEPEREAFVDIIQKAPRALISTPTALEARMVVHGRRGERAVVLLDDLLRLPMFELVAPGEAELQAAFAAFVAYGRGSGHPAGLNYGDLFSYALAKARGLSLLFKGEGFSQTDILPVWRPAS